MRQQMSAKTAPGTQHDPRAVIDAMAAGAAGLAGLSATLWLSRRAAQQRAESAVRRRDGHDVHGTVRRIRRGRRFELVRAQPPTVSVVIPTLNEEASIEWVLSNLPSCVDEVILVDGLSIDRTVFLARRALPDLLVIHESRPGKGAALRAGFAAASGDIVVMLDADGSTDPREIDRYVEALMMGADFVKGSRQLEGGGSADFTPARRWGNRAFVTLYNLLYGARFTDLCYGYCAFWREHLDDLALTADGFEIETQLVAHAYTAGLAIVEVPSFERERLGGSSNLNPVRDGARVLRTLVQEHPSSGPAAPASPAPDASPQPGAADRRAPAGADAAARRA
jgi:hypothetical protein